MYKLLAVLATVSACVDTLPALPRIALRAPEPMPVYQDGARAWAALGFELDGADERIECPRAWAALGDYACQITIVISRPSNLRELEGTNALANRADRLIAIDARVTDYYALLVASAHEVGHIVLDTSEHTAGGVMGGASWTLEAVDYALACKTIGVGC